MPRPPRLDVPGTAQHVIQRGNNREPCFLESAHYRYYLGALRECALREACEIHAYVLMTNHVHLLVTGRVEGGVSRMMQGLGRRFVRHLNDTTGRTGTLWEGRFKSNPVDNETYVLACYRYIELNPVRAGLARDPAGYRWSSYAGNALGRTDALLAPHVVYEALGADTASRLSRYRAFVGAATGVEEAGRIRQHAQRQRALGSERFVGEIEARLGRRAGIGSPGRPRKGKAAEKVL